MDTYTKEIIKQVLWAMSAMNNIAVVSVNEYHSELVVEPTFRVAAKDEHGGAVHYLSWPEGFCIEPPTKGKQ